MSETTQVDELQREIDNLKERLAESEKMKSMWFENYQDADADAKLFKELLKKLTSKN